MTYDSDNNGKPTHEIMGTNGERPTPLKPRWDGLPHEISRGPQHNRWVVWKLEKNDKGKWTKPLYRAVDPSRHASSTWDDSWASLATARLSYETHNEHDGKGDVAGVGYVCEPGMVVIDIDHCVAPDGTLSLVAQDIIKSLATNTSVSASGEGIRLLCYGKLPPRPAGAKQHYKNTALGLEMYDETSARYVTLTGHLLPGTPTEIKERQAEIEAVHARYFPHDEPAKADEAAPANASVASTEGLPTGITVEDVLHAVAGASNGLRIISLWEGQWEQAGYGSQSEADQAFCNLFAFYAPTAGGVDVLMRASGLMREKWDREAYRDSTIENALACLENTYDWAPLQASRAVDAIKPIEAPMSDGERLALSTDPWPREIDYEACLAADVLDELRPQKAAKPSGYKFKPISSAQFAATEYRVEWLVKGMVVRGQPCVMGGARKALKTTLLTDLAISLGTGLPFLGVYRTTKARTVFISGESGEFTIKETANRICATKGIPLSQCDVWWDFRLPRLSIEDELKELGRGLAEYGAEVVLVDPLYLCLLSGNKDAKPGSMFDMGPILSDVSRTCLAANATPFLAHHAVKHVMNPYAPLELEDLAFSGIQEFARQWLLISRREPYRPGTGLHKMFLGWGGSVGHGGLKGLDIDEGQLQDDFTGRKWAVDVVSLDEIKEAKAAERAAAKDATDGELEAELVAYITTETQCTLTKIKNKLGWYPGKATRIVQRLLAKQLITATEEKVPGGNGASRTGVVYRIN